MKRLDLLLFEKGLVKSREKARALIMEGVVSVNGTPVTKAGAMCAEDAELLIREDTVPFVSRGGLKLEKAVRTFSITLEHAAAADIGASTGGFTDCMLQHGASHVYAIDVGYGQLDWKLRTDERVTVMERTNARYMEPSWFEGPLDFASIDVSFISLSKILPGLLPCLKEGGQVAALIKPQFEAGRKEVGKNGVVRNETVHASVIRKVLDFSLETGFHVRGLSYSPITGPKGNIEFLLYLVRPAGTENPECSVTEEDCAETVREAHRTLAERAAGKKDDPAE